MSQNATTIANVATLRATATSAKATKDAARVTLANAIAAEDVAKNAYIAALNADDRAAK